jgi:hypothetical protein
MKEGFKAEKTLNKQHRSAQLVRGSIFDPFVADCGCGGGGDVKEKGANISTEVEEIYLTPPPQQQQQDLGSIDIGKDANHLNMMGKPRGVSRQAGSRQAGRRKGKREGYRV